MADAEDVSIKYILEDEELVLAECRSRGITDEKDDLRREALGKAVRVLETDERDMTVLCRVPATGDIWFALECLAHLRPKPPDDMDHHYYGQYQSHLSHEETALALVEQSGVEAMHVSYEEHYKGLHSEALRKLHDLESELRVGRTTMAEAKDAAKELQFQLKEEEAARLKYAQKLESLRKKVAARLREQKQLMETVRHQEERVAMVSKSRDEYLELVTHMFDKKHQLKDKLVYLPKGRQEEHAGGKRNGGSSDVRRASPQSYPGGRVPLSHK